jgi:AraC family transcriptional regulator, transcriptional activator of pobA
MDQSGAFLYDSNMSATAPIPNFNLFGEQGDLPDVVHCETISARSTLHDWEFAPHRHARLHQILLLTCGAGEVTLDGTRHALPPDSLVNVPVGLVHGYRFDPGTQGFVVTFAAEMLDESLRPPEGLRPVLARSGVSKVDADTRMTMTQIADAYAGRDFGRAHILRSLAGLLLGQVARLMQRADPTETPGEPGLLPRFQALIEERYTLHWGVAEYARTLAISPTHLSRVARAATGRPASALIEDRVVREARRYLVYTDLPVSRIAYALGFEDPAYFSRVFSRATGVSPKAFRHRLNRGDG